MRALGWLVILAACHGSSQSFSEGVQALCDVPDHVPDSGERYDKRLAATMEWAEQHVTNPDAKKIGDLKNAQANKDALAEAVKKAGIAHCKLLDNGMELQSFADAMKIVCNGPAKDASAYFASHLLNTEVVRMFAALGDVNPADRADKVHAAIARAGLTECHFFDAASTTVAENVPTVPAGGLDKLAANGPTITITPTGLVVEGKAIVALKDGAVDPSELDGGAMGIAIPRLGNFLKSLAENLAANGGTDPKSGVTTFRKDAGTLPPIVLAIDPAIPYRTLVSVMFTAKHARFRDFAVVVRAGRDLAAIPLTLPDPKPFKGTPPLNVTSADVQPIVSITKDHVLLWSISGLEGTLKKPKVDVALDHIADVRKALADIAARRKPKADSQIIIMADAAIPMQKIAEVMAAVRSDDTGKPLFPSIVLSSGFE